MGSSRSVRGNGGRVAKELEPQRRGEEKRHTFGDLRPIEGSGGLRRAATLGRPVVSICAGSGDPRTSRENVAAGRGPSTQRKVARVFAVPPLEAVVAISTSPPACRLTVALNSTTSPGRMALRY